MTITPTTEAMLLDQVRALATDDPDFFLDLLELIAAVDASIVDDESLVDGAKAVLDKLQARRGAAENCTELRRQLLAHTLQQIRLKTLRTPIATLPPRKRV
jgi:beta-phosphoglucomutase-like phosphatase (HAD superfamily)